MEEMKKNRSNINVQIWSLTQQLLTGYEPGTQNKCRL